jgi:hypothetical protein
MCADPVVDGVDLRRTGGKDFAARLERARTVCTKRLVLENKLYDDRHLKYQIQYVQFCT